MTNDYISQWTLDLLRRAFVADRYLMSGITSVLGKELPRVRYTERYKYRKWANKE
jgi:hypothetical protein